MVNNQKANQMPLACLWQVSPSVCSYHDHDLHPPTSYLRALPVLHIASGYKSRLQKCSWRPQKRDNKNSPKQTWTIKHDGLEEEFAFSQRDLGCPCLLAREKKSWLLLGKPAVTVLLTYQVILVHTDARQPLQRLSGTTPPKISA